jgi:diguanylate cyclase
MAVRLETERSRAEAVHERQRASSLEAANTALSERAVALSEEASQDVLTGLANRRRLDSVLAQRHADAMARNVPLCVALLDVDHFKRVNDGHSHAVGDLVLKQLGAILRAHCRDDDLAARYGGEEFVLMFAGVGPVRAAAVCERVRLAIEDFDWPSLAPGLAVTASFGVCDIAGHAGPAEGLARADALMYRAKSAGRNRVSSEG